MGVKKHVPNMNFKRSVTGSVLRGALTAHILRVPRGPAEEVAAGQTSIHGRRFAPAAEGQDVTRPNLDKHSSFGLFYSDSEVYMNGVVGRDRSLASFIYPFFFDLPTGTKNRGDIPGRHAETIREK